MLRGDRAIAFDRRPAPRARRSSWLLGSAFLALAATALVPGAALAREVRVGLLTLEAPPVAERSLLSLAERAPAILSGLESDLGVRFRQRFVIHLVPESGPVDSAVAALDAGAPEWAAGYLVPSKRAGGIRIARSRSYPYGTLESVLAHEAAHMLLHDAGTRELPLWFHEGVATLEGRRWSLEDAMIYSSGLLTADLPALADLDAAFHATASEAEMAYAASFAFVSRAARRHGPRFVPRILESARRRPFAEAWREIAGIPLEESERVWRRDSLIRYRWLPILTASSTLWIGITVLALVAAARRRQRMQRQREAWIEDESQVGNEDEPWSGSVEEASPPPEDSEESEESSPPTR